MPKIGDTQTLRLDGWQDIYLGENRYMLTPTEKTLSATGSDATKKLIVPFPFKILKMELKHTDAAKADNAAAITWSLKKNMGDAASGFKLIAYTDATITDFIEIFDESWDFNARTLTLTYKTTNGHLLYVNYVIEQVPDGVFA